MSSHVITPGPYRATKLVSYAKTETLASLLRYKLIVTTTMANSRVFKLHLLVAFKTDRYLSDSQ